MIQPELKAYRRCSDRHVLVLETNLTYVEKCQIFHYADLVRKAGNELTGIMKKRYDQLVRTKRYRKLKSLYKKYKDADNKKALKDVCDQMKEMQKQYDVTWDYCRTSMIPIGKKNRCRICTNESGGCISWNRKMSLFGWRNDSF